MVNNFVIAYLSFCYYIFTQTLFWTEKQNISFNELCCNFIWNQCLVPERCTEVRKITKCRTTDFFLYAINIKTPGNYNKGIRGKKLPQIYCENFLFISSAKTEAVHLKRILLASRLFCIIMGVFQNFVHRHEIFYDKKTVQDNYFISKSISNSFSASFVIWPCLEWALEKSSLNWILRKYV